MSSMTKFGLGMVVLGVLSEVFGGEMFRHFFDPRWPQRLPASERLKVVLFRFTLAGGVLVAVLGLVVSW